MSGASSRTRTERKKKRELHWLRFELFRDSFRWSFALALVLLFCSCGDDAPVAELGEELSGGDTTVFDTSVNAFSLSARNLSSDERRDFVVGNSFFNQNWVMAPSSTDGRDGLGPLFNARSCSGCHLRDGRGAPPETPEEALFSVLLRLGIPSDSAITGSLPDPAYGDQFQPLGVQGVPGEGAVFVENTEISGQYGDGESFTLLRPTYRFEQLAYGPLHPDVQISPRVAPQMIGMGLLEAIPEETLRQLADPDDRNGDGVSGRLNQVRHERSGSTVIGRFGWKANQPDIEQQVAGAFLGDVGITTDIFPNENCTTSQAGCQQSATGGHPEADSTILDRVTFYSRTLAVPARRGWDTPDVLEGRELFQEIGCASCHTPKLQTGPFEIPALANQEIRPFSDLLLHDMGPELADGRPDFLATEQEWRTPPLWGLGLIPTVNGHTRLLHDGRARNPAEAILWHGGEAESAREAFRNLSRDQRAQLLLFLNSL